MASQFQIDANRRNSLQSTGPRSLEGKAVSRFNALKSGIHAEAQIIPGEDPAELDALAAAYHDEFRPSTSLECFLVDTLVHADWQLRRLHRLEAQLWTSQIAEIQEDAPLGRAYAQSLDAFTRLQRRIDSTERSYYRALKELRARAVEPAIPEPSAPELASFCPPPPEPSAAAHPSQPVHPLPGDEPGETLRVPPLDRHPEEG
jgi:hypothetical protein